MTDKEIYKKERYAVWLNLAKASTPEVLAEYLAKKDTDAKYGGNEDTVVQLATSLSDNRAWTVSRMLEEAVEDAENREISSAILILINKQEKSFAKSVRFVNLSSIEIIGHLDVVKSEMLAEVTTVETVLV